MVTTKGNFMGYFDGIADRYFGKSETGEILFYPWGIFGKGYILNPQNDYNLIRSFIKKFYIIGLPVIILSQILFGLIGSLVVLMFLFFWYNSKIVILLKDVPKTDKKFSIIDSCKNSARSHNLFDLIFLEICSIGFVIAGVWVFYHGDLIIALSAIAFFGLCTIVGIFMIVEKIKSLL